MPQNLARVFAAELQGIEAKLIEVEVDLNIGLHSFNIVGLADKALSEAKERVSSALKNSGFRPPIKENRKITVNLAPADVKKTGSQYDLAIAVGYLLASRQIQKIPTEDKLFFGELSLEGHLRPVAGALNVALLTKKLGFGNLFLPRQNAREASLISGLQIFPVDNLASLINHLENLQRIHPHPKTSFHPKATTYLDITEIRGQEAAKRALTVAASGGHNILMSGPPGSGKTMLAQALISLLPPPTLAEALEISRIWSAANLLKESYAEARPFRAPHHTASPVSIVGGGQDPRPGEISLAHRGVLFLDELPEFRRDLLAALRQPLEGGEIVISRAKNNLTFPARFTLVAAMNPCPCGYYGDPEKDCRCTAYEVFRYQKKISGPLLDRIDIHITVPRLKIENLRKPVEESHPLRGKVAQTRKIQTERFRKAGLKILTNSEMSSKECEKLVILTKEADDFLKSVFDKSLLSARGYYRLLKASRTIADLEAKEKVEASHLAEAFQLRIRED